MNLDTVAERLGCSIASAHPVLGDWGEYNSATHTITLHPALSGIQYTATLAHELGHAAHRHEQSTPATEREADYFAHWLLIPLCGFLRAAQAHHTMQGVAHELELLPSMLASYAGRIRGCCHERAPGAGHGRGAASRSASTDTTRADTR
ncbi:ImmA/IrrE family metallo-endopeptidase [Citricoccus sp. NR2]|uniref:ImmA/IrrE family metallo-endopeptidase n=1 Tax=Citricoccus sp. NR2 TaxID=3004095 RepID=UPI003FA41F72